MNDFINYQEVIDSFDKLPENEKDPFIYPLFGYSLYLVQNLEKLLINIIFCNKITTRKNETEKELIDFANNLDFGNKTMGGLIAEIKRTLAFKENDLTQLESTLKSRNYFVHDYFKFNTELLYSINGKKRIIKDLVDFKNQIEVSEAVIHKYVDMYLQHFGYTRERYNAELKEAERKWEMLEINDNFKTIHK